MLTKLGVVHNIQNKKKKFEGRKGEGNAFQDNISFTKHNMYIKKQTCS
jgi:hypothetical protein